ncbi:hypothetical protein KIN20_022622 [Parelaphostrongylus tenuis]|uniref:Uncharacterized protein n=1 Tax=Parelaphostrongylus tenuis TaxID=148309 RepID=A0AAD5MUF2_PARTN|nr:hypothetical protein KIN20_022622 [Parelaphostrongylus tenuis]
MVMTFPKKSYLFNASKDIVPHVRCNFIFSIKANRSTISSEQLNGDRGRDLWSGTLLQDLTNGCPSHFSEAAVSLESCWRRGVSYVPLPWSATLLVFGSLPLFFTLDLCLCFRYYVWNDRAVEGRGPPNRLILSRVYLRCSYIVSGACGYGGGPSPLGSAWPASGDGSESMYIESEKLSDIFNHPMAPTLGV